MSRLRAGALLLCGVAVLGCAAGRAAAHDVRARSWTLSVTDLTDSGFAIDPAQFRKGVLYDKTAFVVAFPVATTGEACDQKTPLLTIANPDLVWVPGDYTHTSQLVLSMTPRDGVFHLDVTAYPDVEGEQPTVDNELVPLVYTYPLLDRLSIVSPDENRCVQSQTYRFEVSLYFNANNILLQVTRPGTGISPVYLSPVSLGVGETIFERLRFRSAVSITSTAVPAADSGFVLKRATMSALYWEAFDRPDTCWGDTAPPYCSNLLDDLNLGYGAASLPFRAPFLTRTYRGLAAAADVTD